MTVTIPNTSVNSDHNIHELTSSDGNGVFDLMMNAVKQHIHEEFKANRIRGTDYANVYLGSLNQVLSQASNYALSKSKLALELQLLEAQILKTATDTAVATKQGALIEAQTNREIREAERIHAETTLKLPLELARLQAEIALAEKELLIKEKQITLAEKEILLKEKQIPIVERELEIKLQQLEVAKSEVEIKRKQVEMAEYELKYKLPAEVRLTNTQADLYNQKIATEKAQTNGDDVKPNSVIHYQNVLLQEQAKTYLRDAMQKFLKMYVDSWSVRNNSDPDGNGANEQNKLLDVNVGEVVRHTANDLGISLPK